MKNLVARADHIAVLTGAGISAESGIPTFRGAGGLWRNFRPEDLATPEAFARDPGLVWEWYDWRRGRIAAAQPNAGHLAIARLAGRKRVTLVTQNVDGLHSRAGSKDVIEFHGNIWRTRCLQCRRVTVDERVPLPELPPRCACGGLVRPDVVWFGEMIPPHLLEAAFAAVEVCDLLLVVGTSMIVYPAASLAEVALMKGTPVIEVNVERTPLSDRARFLHGPSAKVLPELLAP